MRVLRVAEEYHGTDTGRQRRANEDSVLAHAPLFVVADGMGGANAGEVASRIAVESFDRSLEDGSNPEGGLAARAQAANSRIHELSRSKAEHAGMGTTLTAVYVGEQEVSIAHVGDSRAYRLRDGALERLTDDHSLVDELMRQGKLTAAEAEEHPQRSIITRALGPEATVEVDTRSYRARPGDVYLLCSDGLTTMVPEQRLAEVLKAHPLLHDTGEALIAEANKAGGRDNITVVLIRLEEVGVPASALQDRHAPITGAPEPVVSARRPRSPRARVSPSESPRRRLRRAGAALVVLIVLGILATGAYLASQSVYFIATNQRGLVTLYRGLPYELPGGIRLYSSYYVSGVSASTLSGPRRHTLLDHSLRSENDASDLLRRLERGQLSGG